MKGRGLFGNMYNKKFLGMFMPNAGFYLWVILLLVAVIAVLDWRIAIPGFLLLVFLTYYNISSNYKRKVEIASYIENLNFNIDATTKDTLLNFPMPLVVCELNGSIVWYNSSFRKITENENMLEDTVKSLVGEIRPENLKDGSAGISRQIMLGGRHYKVLCNFARHERKQDSRQDNRQNGRPDNKNGGYDNSQDDRDNRRDGRPDSKDSRQRNKPDGSEYILVLYFFDVTELVELKKTYAEEKIMAGIIVIDNYDELMQSMEDTNRPQMLAEIDKKVNQWMSFTNGIIRKYERDKYIFLFEYKYLKEFEEKRFDILDSIKEINLGNKIPVTLSLGFGLNGKTPLENLHSASAAIDIALGRGGDQVVVKNGDSFSFFGGKTRELEKRTKVKARVIAFALRELIDQSENIFIMGHESADIDSLGASLGLYRIVKSRGKNAHIVLNKLNPTIESLVARIQKDEEYEDLFIGRNEALDMAKEKSLLIIVDTHRPGFTEIPELIGVARQVVVIDHHRRGADYIQDTVLTYQETYASSTCELVTEILQYVDEKLRLRPLEAEALYAGIVVDTKNFTFKTGVRTFEAASYLKRQGVDTVAVKQLFQNDFTTYNNISGVVKKAEMISNDIAISVCPPGTKNAQLIAAKAADELLNLSGINAAFVLCNVGNEVWISGRSLGDINVQMILEKLGGGGHLTVAGAQLAGIALEDAKDRLKYAIMGYVKELNKPV